MINQDQPIIENSLNQQPDNQLPLQMSSFPSFQSVSSLNDKKNNAGQEQVQELQVVQNKFKNRINHEEIMKMFNEQVEREQKERQQIQKRRKQLMKKKSSTSQQPNKNSDNKNPEKMEKELKAIKENEEKMLAYLERTSRIKHRISEHCKKYKAMYRPSIYDTKMQKYRFENKEKVFFYLCYGFEQLKQLDSLQLAPIEQEFVRNSAYNHCKRLAFEIDLEMVRMLNKNDKSEINREYKLQFQKLINNLKDEHNFQLKKRILNKQLTPQKIAVANQIEFYTAAKREEILEKQKRIVAQFTVETLYNPYLQKETEEVITERPALPEDLQKEETTVLKSTKSGYSNKYIQESVIVQLEQLLSVGHLQKMLRRLCEDLKGLEQANLISHFNSTFHL